MDEACENCAYYKVDQPYGYGLTLPPDTPGECLRYPRYLTVPLDVRVVSKDGWCGEFDIKKHLASRGQGEV